MSRAGAILENYYAQLARLSRSLQTTIDISNGYPMNFIDDTAVVLALGQVIKNVDIAKDVLDDYLRVSNGQ